MRRVLWFGLLALAALVVASVALAGSKTGAAKPPAPAEVAYAFVIPGEVSLNVDPLFVTGRTKGFTSVVSPAAGVFCLAPAVLDGTKMSWTVTPEVARSTSSAKLLIAYVDVSTACGAGNIRVRTYVMNAASVVSPSENVAFMVVAAG